jgi:hypothetical protein
VISDLFPKSRKLDIAEVRADQLTGMKAVDFVAISAHGHVGLDDETTCSLRKGVNSLPHLLSH